MSTNDYPSASEEISHERPEAVRVEPKPSRWFDAYDQAAFYVILVMIPFLAAIGYIIGPIIDWIIGRSMVAADSGQLEFPDATVDQLAGLDYGNVSAQFYLEDPSAAQRLIGLIVPVFVVAALVLVSVLLIRVTNDVARGFAFSRSNITRLRVLSVVVFAMSFVLSFGPSLTAAVLAPSPDDLETVVTTFDLGPLAFGTMAAMAIAMLSQAFSVGSQLADDVSELI